MKRNRRSFLKMVGSAGVTTVTAVIAPVAVLAETNGAGAGLRELNRLDASELALRIARREISPVEVIEATLLRFEETEPAINAFTAFDADGARRAAYAAEAAVMRGDALGSLHGVPVSVKDLIDVAGLPVSYGSLIMKDNVARADSVVVERVRKAGAIIVGKTATSEFGYSGNTKSLVNGVTRNPWNLALTPGGSSGGAAASVAAGVTPIALGTDGGGSIRQPSSLTGLVGIKPNLGRVPFWPAGVNPTLLHVGPIARSVADAALLLGAIAGPDARDAQSLLTPMGREPDPQTVRSLRVAFSPTLGYAKVDAPVERVVTAAIDRLHNVFPTLLSVPDAFPDAREIHQPIFLAGISARLGDAVDITPELIDPPLVAAVKRFRQMSADSYSRILRQQVEYRDIMRQFFERYDILLTPTLPSVAWDTRDAFPSGQSDYSYFTRPFNQTGQPAASIPCGLTPAKLPVGLQVVTRLGEEATLVAALRVIEATLGARMTPVEIVKG